MKFSIVLAVSQFLLSTLAVGDDTVDPNVCSKPVLKRLGRTTSMTLNALIFIQPLQANFLTQSLNSTVFERTDGKCEVRLVQGNSDNRNETGLMVWEFETKFGYLTLFVVPGKPIKNPPVENQTP